MTIYCTGCNQDVEARLTNGSERYPHRLDLYEVPFWKCDTCGNYVGCHYKSTSPTSPLGCIATPDLVHMRKKIHSLLDPLWKEGKTTRASVYAHISRELGKQYHTGEIRSIEEAKHVLRIVRLLHTKYQKP